MSFGINPSVTIIPSGTETSEVYHRSGAWGSTLLSVFRSSPRLANAIRTGAYRPLETAAMRFGSRFHDLMDPSSGFATRCICGPDVDRRTVAWRNAETAAKEAGKELIIPDDWEALHRMRDSVHANPVARFLLDGAEHEVGFRMTLPGSTVQVQCRADVLHRWSHLADLKTTTDLDDFSHSVTTYGYHRQAALYRWIVQQACGEVLPFSFIVVEKAAPFYRCRVIDLSPKFLAIGWQEVEETLAAIAERMATGDWGDHHDADLVEPPTWLLRSLMPPAAPTLAEAA